MLIYLDTADVEEVRRYAGWGVVDGVTTNPTLVARSGRRHEDVVVEMCALVPGPVSAEVLAEDVDGMVREGRMLAGLHPQIVVKIPLVPAGLAAVRRLADEGIRTNVTLCFSAGQALLAAKAGATMVSPFVGRLDDRGERGMALVEEIVAIYRAFPRISTEVLVASVRSTDHVREAARLGADACTLPPRLLEQLVQHELTTKGLAAFLADHRAAQAAAAPAAARA